MAIPKFVNYDKQYPYYNAYTEDGRKAYIEVNARDKAIRVFGISGKEVDPAKGYRNLFDRKPVMKILMEYATALGNDRRTRLWDYYLYIDSCAGAGLTDVLARSSFETFTREFSLKPSEVVKLTRKHNCDYDAMYAEAMAERYTKGGFGAAEIDFLADWRSYFCDETIQLIMGDLQICRQFMAWADAPYAKVIGKARMRDYFNDYSRITVRLEQAPICGDFWVSYLETKKAEARQKEAVFREAQTKRNLVYEHDVFCVVVPTSKQECEDEGEKLHNCLGGFEWSNYLSSGRRQVVFIRRKSEPKKAYIACDINAETGEIIQYLTYCNNNVKEDDAREFYREYQEYLRQIYQG